MLKRKAEAGPCDDDCVAVRATLELLLDTSDDDDELIVRASAVLKSQGPETGPVGDPVDTSDVTARFSRGVARKCFSYVARKLFGVARKMLVSLGKFWCRSENFRCHSNFFWRLPICGDPRPICGDLRPICGDPKRICGDPRPICGN